MSLRALVSLAAGALALAGIAVASEWVVARRPVAGRVTVLYWEKWTGDEGAKMRAIVDDFNRSQDRIYVKMLSISGVADKTLLATSGGNPPDVAGLWGEQIAQFADAGALLDLTALARERGVRSSQYIGGYWQMITYRGRLFALPSTPASTALHINTDMLPAGMAPPRTIEELDAFTNRVSKKGPDGRLQLAGFLPAEPGWWNYGWGYWFGGRLLEGDRLTVDAPENIRAFEWVQSYSKRFGVRETQNFQSGFGNFSSPQNAFLNNKVASVLQGVWMANFIHLYNPKLRWIAVPFPLPADRPDLKGRNFLGLDTLVIPRGARHPREAFEFMQFVQRQDEMEKLCKSHGKNSPLSVVSEAFLSSHPNPYIRLFDRLARSPAAVWAPQVGIWPQLSNELTNAFQVINLGQKSPRAALEAAQARLEPQWNRYRRQVLGEAAK